MVNYISLTDTLDFIAELFLFLSFTGTNPKDIMWGKYRIILWKIWKMQVCNYNKGSLVCVCLCTHASTTSSLLLDLLSSVSASSCLPHNNQNIRNLLRMTHDRQGDFSHGIKLENSQSWLRCSLETSCQQHPLKQMVPTTWNAPFCALQWLLK